MEFLYILLLIYIITNFLKLAKNFSKIMKFSTLIKYQYNFFIIYIHNLNLLMEDNKV